MAELISLGADPNAREPDEDDDDDDDDGGEDDDDDGNSDSNSVTTDEDSLDGDEYRYRSRFHTDSGDEGGSGPWRSRRSRIRRGGRVRRF